jgi:hypothetical protein
LLSFKAWGLYVGGEAITGVGASIVTGDMWQGPYLNVNVKSGNLK